MSCYNEFNAVFWSGIATVVMGGIGLAIKYGLKSKCDDVSLCFGCIKIHRRVELEAVESASDEENNRNSIGITIPKSPSPKSIFKTENHIH